MMFGRRNKKKYVKLWQNDREIYQGLWDGLPLAEAMILKKSVDFFDDPDPCYIHRDAVKVRLLAELEEALQDVDLNEHPEGLDLLSQYMGMDITRITFFLQ